MSKWDGADFAPSNFAYEMMVFAVAIMVLFPTALSLFTSYDSSAEDAMSDLTEAYEEFTGNTATSESVWALTGIYTPYYSGTYGYTDDGWLYGTLIPTYTPSQYEGDVTEYTVVKSGDVYVYAADTAYGDYEEGDLYTYVTMDVSQKSSIFFTSSSKTEVDGFFYYEYTGYRYSFQPLADYTGYDSDGNATYVSSNTTSLSLIWYDYYGSSGVSGQLVLSGSDSGVAYITASDIISAFDSITSVAQFDMVFNGVSMNVYIRIDPYYISLGYSVEQCYTNGYWSIMVSSLSTDLDSYISTDYSFNIYSVFQTMIDLFAFNLEDYGLSSVTSYLASAFFVIPLFLAMIAIGMSFYPVLILAGIYGVIEVIAAIF